MIEHPEVCIVRIREGERITGSLAEALDPVDAATIHEFVLPANADVELHYHDFDEYWLFTAGEPQVTLQTPNGTQKTYELHPGDMVACVRGVAHTLKADHPLVYFQFSSVRREGAREGHLTDG